MARRIEPPGVTAGITHSLVSTVAILALMCSTVAFGVALHHDGGGDVSTVGAAAPSPSVIR